MAKTIKIVELLDEVNRMNRESTCHPEGRMALNSLLEGILMKNDVYAGFNNLRAHEVPEGQLPGMIESTANPIGMTQFEFPDDSRRVYYMHRNLRATSVRKSTEKLSEKS